MTVAMRCECKYGKCFKSLNTFLYLLSNKMLVIRAGIHQMLVRIANRVWAVCLNSYGRQLVLEISEHLQYDLLCSVLHRTFSRLEQQAAYL